VGAVAGPASGRPDWIRSSTDDAVREAEVWHLRTERASRIEHHGIRKSGDMIDRDILQQRNKACVELSFNLSEDAMTGVFVSTNVIDNHIMNAVALALLGVEASSRNNVRQLEAAAHVTDGVIAECDVGYRANCAVTIVLGGRDDGETGLRKSSSSIFHDVAFDQNTLHILKFQMILDHKLDSDETGLAGQPDHGLEEMVASNLDVGWSLRGSTAAEDDAFSGRFQKVVYDLVGSIGNRAISSCHRLRIRALPHGVAVEVGEIGIDDRDRRTAVQQDSTRRFIVRESVKPYPVEDDVVESASSNRRSQRYHKFIGCMLCDFQADESVVSGAIFKHQRSGEVSAVVLDFCYDVFRGDAVESRTPRERADTSITRGQPRSFRG